MRTKRIIVHTICNYFGFLSSCFLGHDDIVCCGVAVMHKNTGEKEQGKKAEE